MTGLPNRSASRVDRVPQPFGHGLDLIHRATVGSVLVVAGTLSASACTQYWQLLLAQGVCVGLGNGCLFCPAVALVSTYFAKRRSFVIGITACGSGAGGVIFPIVIREMLPRAGFGWIMRTLGFIQAAALVTALFCLKPRVPPRKTGSFVELAAFKDLDYSFYAAGASLFFWASYIVFFFLAAYTRDIQGVSYDQPLDLLMITNGVGIVGRLLLNHLADHVGNLTMFVPTIGAAALLAYCWAPIASRAGLYVWVTLCGIALGGIQALFPSALASLTADPQKQGARIGMVFTTVSEEGKKRTIRPESSGTEKEFDVAPTGFVESRLFVSMSAEDNLQTKYCFFQVKAIACNRADEGLQSYQQQQEPRRKDIHAYSSNLRDTTKVEDPSDIGAQATAVSGAVPSLLGEKEHQSRHALSA
ncbi:riboflavin transporter MCH5 [Colletotrichum salicis]|uniref:Riboflavin transporter MCH5 n=1 Tax=Colletotrichum salicis TaxID=1209931 RepID=A0A135U0C6_9PEZI|nr:riboflavin transporter MCH5 [Colletotrichum salicis]